MIKYLPMRMAFRSRCVIQSEMCNTFYSNSLAKLRYKSIIFSFTYTQFGKKEDWLRYAPIMCECEFCEMTTVYRLSIRSKIA